MHDFSAVKESVRSRVDLVDIVSEQTPLTRRGRNLLGLCPFHQEKTPSFSVNAEQQFFKCFGCGAGGDVFSFVQRRDNVDFSEALRILADRAGVDLTPGDSARQGGGSTRADIARVNDWALRFFAKRLQDENVGASTREYVEKRGISPESVDRFAIGLAIGGQDTLLRAAESAGVSRQLLTDAGLCKKGIGGGIYDTFRDRLMFPIRDTTGRCIGFGGRTLVDADAKYMNTPETLLFNKRKSLYGIDLARESITSERTALLVEGYTDCIACHQYGFTNAMATLGTSVTDDHMGTLRRYCDTVILVLDADVAGEAAAERALGIGLRRGLAIRLASTSHAKDPCDFLQTSGANEFRTLLKYAEDALVFQWRRTRERFEDGKTPAAKRSAADAFLALVGELSQFGAIDAVQQGIIVGQLSNLLAVPAERIRSAMFKRHRRVVRGSEETISRRPGRPKSADQAALVEILHLLVVHPGLYARVSEEFEAERFAEPAYRRIASDMASLVTERGGFTLSDLLALTQETEEGDLLTDLASEGMRLTEEEADVAMSAAVLRLREAAEDIDTHRLASSFRESVATGGAEQGTELRDQLAMVQQRLATRRGFAHARAIGELGRVDPVLPESTN